MRFWDTSALVPLFLREPTTEQMRRLHREDEQIHAWWATRVECLSAIARLAREGMLDSTGEAMVQATLTDLLRSVNEIEPTHVVRERATRLLGVHPLRAADALQLGAALTWARDRPHGMTLVSLDERLRTAARLEGFTLLPDPLT